MQRGGVKYSIMLPSDTLRFTLGGLVGGGEELHQVPLRGGAEFRRKRRKNSLRPDTR